MNKHFCTSSGKRGCMGTYSADLGRMLMEVMCELGKNKRNVMLGHFQSIQPSVGQEPHQVP